MAIPLCVIRTTRQKPIVGTPVDWSNSLSKDLIGCWLFNECGSYLVMDVARKNNGQVLESVALTARSQFGGGSLWSDTVAYVDAGNKPIYNITGSFTLSTWVYAGRHNAGGVYTRIITHLTGFPYNGYELVMAAGDAGGALVPNAAYLQLGNNGTITVGSDTTALPIMQWTHLACSYNQPTGNIKFYNNGRLKSTSSVGTSAIGANSIAFQIGRAKAANLGQGFYGNIDVPCIWNRVLKDEEVCHLYNNPFAFIRQEGFKQGSIPPPPLPAQPQSILSFL
jgi:hypothetical protein